MAVGAAAVAGIFQFRAFAAVTGIAIDSFVFLNIVGELSIRLCGRVCCPGFLFFKRRQRQVVVPRGFSGIPTAHSERRDRGQNDRELDFV